jgi:hypothetical protein
MWAYSNMGNGTCEASMLLAMELAESWHINLSTRSVDHCQKVEVVVGWLDMYRNHGEYISTEVRVVWNKGK